MKKFLSTILSLCFVIGLFAGIGLTTPAQAASWTYDAVDIDSITPGHQYFSAGIGDSTNPFEISTAQELANLAFLVNHAVPGYFESTFCYELTADIVLNPGTFSSSGTYTPAAGESPAPWTPIGLTTKESGFQGSFNGNGHTISGLDYDGSAEGGLFRYSNGVIMNVGVTGYVRSSQDAGGIASRNLHTISNCWSDVTVVSNSASDYSAGGIVGVNGGGGVATIRNCFSIGTISANATSGDAGGIAGYCFLDGTIENCYSTGTVSGGDAAGGVVGFAGTALNNCYWLNSGPSSATGRGAASSTSYSFPSNQTFSPSITVSSTSCSTLLAALNAYSTSTWFSTASLNGGYPVLAGYGGGSGTSGDPYLISNAQQLTYLSNMVNSGTAYNGIYFLMTNDIALNPGTFSSSGAYTPVAAESPVTWTPIGNGATNFQGTFNGGGHAVYGVYINNSGGNYQGLFGSILAIGTIENLGIVNSYIKGGGFVGGVLGYCHATVGWSATVQNCYNAGYISGNSGVGGVVGYVGTSGNIVLDRCFNTGSVSGNAIIGGLVGYVGTNSDTVIERCYNTGNISGNSNVGGVIGYDNSASSSISTVQYCYNAGSVSGGSNVGGVAGVFADTAKILDCYYDKQICTTGGVTGADIAGRATGLLTSSMVGSSLFGGTDPKWTFSPGLYPRLADPSATVDMDGTDTAIVSATPIFLYDNSAVTSDDFNTAPYVTKSFTVGTGSGVSWVSSNTGTVSIGGSAATVTRKTSDTAVTLTANKGNVSRSVTLKVSALPFEATPLAAFSYASGTLTGLTANANYRVNAASFTASSAGTISIASAWFGTTVSIVKAGDGTSTQDSATQSLTIPARPATPSAPVLASKTSTEIKVTAVSGQEYSIDNGAWQVIDTFSGLTANTLHSIRTRVMATGTAFASDTSASLSVTTDTAPSGGGSAATYYTVSADKSSNGTIFLTATSVAGGGSVTATITPDKGYQIADVLINGVSVGAVSSYTIKEISKNATVQALFKKIGEAWTNPYSDLQESAWYYDAISYVSQNGLMKGDARSFDPNGDMTRAMVVTVLFRLGGDSGSYENRFNDVASGAWYEKATAWAAAHGIASGLGNNSFAPEKKLSREQLAVMLYNYAKYKGLNVTVANSGVLDGYLDAGSVSAWAKDAMKWAVSAGIISGDGAKLNPQSNATRAQIAVMLQRFIEKVIS